MANTFSRSILVLSFLLSLFLAHGIEEITPDTTAQQKEKKKGKKKKKEEKIKKGWNVGPLPVVS